jgi:hypothetical protein
MKAKVVWRVGDRAKMMLANGKVLRLESQAIRALNCAMKRGDEGVLIQLPDGSSKFKIDAVDVDVLTPEIEPPRIQLYLPAPDKPVEG